MPPGTPFHGFIPPFPIRVDEFTSTPDLSSVPALYLLSHTHTDHILGLSAKSFASTTICSPDAKEMLLRHETYCERAMEDTDLRDEARASKTFAHLKIPPLLNDGRFDYSASRDLLVRHSHLHTSGSLYDIYPREPFRFIPQRRLNYAIIRLSHSRSLMLTTVLVLSCTGSPQLK
jgi:hypothetical protein